MPDIYGTFGNDTINGTSERESIYALDGDDTIYAGDGSDEINDDWVAAGPGNDIIHGGTGGDSIYDESGNDIVYAGADRDLIYGSSGDDYYDGGTGYDTLSYSSALAGIVVDLNLSSGQVRSLQPNDAAFVGVDTLYNIEYIGGSSFDDQMTGNAGDQRFWGGDGNDMLFGGGGSDELLGGLGNDVLDGGDGFDVAMFAGVTVGVTVSLAISGPQDTGHGFDTLTGIESIQGTYYNDVLIGGGEADLLLGDPGDDRIEGGGGADVIEGGPGSDILTGGPGADIFRDYSSSYMNGDLITDFGPGDKIIFEGAGIYPGSFTFSWIGSTLTFTGGSLTFGTAPSGTLVSRITAEGDVELSLAAGAPDELNDDVRNDFNGDGRSDILWRHDNGLLTDWLGAANGGFVDNAANALTGVPVQWQVAGTGDFNGDGRSDVLWRHDDGRMTDWLGAANGGFIDNAANALTGVPTSWYVAGTGDFNGDNRDDILWRHDDGRMTDWLGAANGGFIDNAANALTGVPISWHIAGTGDFNGDGRDDILWRNDNGMISEWLGAANGGFIDNAANASTYVPTQWHIDGTGDFNGDNRDDILWRHDDGRITNWLGLANGGFADNAANGSTAVPTSWQVASIGDFNGDNRDDILWRHDDGRMTDWLGLANGGFHDNAANASTWVPTDWHVQVHDVLV